MNPDPIAHLVRPPSPGVLSPGRLRHDQFSFGRRWLSPLSLALLILLGLTPLPLEGGWPVQGGALRGVVADPNGAPVAGIAVSLHRVSDLEGAEIGRAVTDSDGRFLIEFDRIEGSGVHFAATRFDGILYMGEAFRTLEDMPEEYRIVIGSGGITGGLAQPSADRPGDQSAWPIALILAALGAAFVGAPLIRARKTPYRIRTTLIELAELEEAHAGHANADLSGDVAVHALGDYEATRRTLHDRLYELTGRARDGADDD